MSEFDTEEAMAAFLNWTEVGIFAMKMVLDALDAAEAERDELKRFAPMARWQARAEAAEARIAKAIEQIEDDVDGCCVRSTLLGKECR